MRTRFEEGQRVRALVGTQGLVKDHEYAVQQVHVQCTPFGEFVVYELLGVVQGEVVHPRVANGHLLLEEVEL